MREVVYSLSSKLLSHIQFVLIFCALVTAVETTSIGQHSEDYLNQLYSRQISSPTYQHQATVPFRRLQSPDLLAPARTPDSLRRINGFGLERFHNIEIQDQAKIENNVAKDILQFPGEDPVDAWRSSETNSTKWPHPNETRELAKPTYLPYSKPRFPVSPAFTEPPIMERTPSNGYPEFQHHGPNAIPAQHQLDPQNYNTYGRNPPELGSFWMVEDRHDGLKRRLPMLESFRSSRSHQIYQGISQFNPHQSSNDQSCHFGCEPAIHYISSFAGSSRVAGLQSAANRIQTERGESFGIAIGKIEGRNLRTEWEYFYRSNGLSDWTGTAVAESIAGRLRTQGTMFNARWEMDNFSVPTLRPYLGAGLGLARFDSQIKHFGGVDLFDSPVRDTQFAWQFLAGVNWKLCPRLNLVVEYRLFRTNSFELTSPVTTSGERFSYQANHLYGGASWRF